MPGPAETAPPATATPSPRPSPRWRRLFARPDRASTSEQWPGIMALQDLAWAAAHPEVEVRVGRQLGPDRRVAQLVLGRYQEARSGDVP